MSARSIRRTVGPAVAGLWYPDRKDALARMVDGYLGPAEDPEQERGPVVALIEPHAGFIYSGAVAGRGFARVRDRTYSRVVLLGPSHYAHFDGAVVPSAEAYRTPLGDVPLDRDVLDRLGLHRCFAVDDRPFEREHSLEAELPFLQRALPAGWKVVPVLLGSGTEGDAAQQIADALRGIVDSRTLTVVSSDFTHYGPRFGYVPFYDDVPRRIRELDMGAVRLIESRDVKGFEDYLARTGATICGRDAIDVLLRLLPGKARAQVIDYQTSGRITGDWDHSVSYAAMVFRES